MLYVLPTGPGLDVGGFAGLAIVIGLLALAVGWLDRRARRARVVLGLALLAAALALVAEDDPASRRRRIAWTVGAGVGACAVGLFWGRWLEGPRRSDDDEDGPPRPGGG